jgi:hypothetical protein
MLIDDQEFQALIDRVTALERKIALIDELVTPKALARISEMPINDDAGIESRRQEHDRLSRAGIHRVDKIPSPVLDVKRPAERLPSMLSGRTRTAQADSLAAQRRHDDEGGARKDAT